MRCIRRNPIMRLLSAGGVALALTLLLLGSLAGAAREAVALPAPTYRNPGSPAVITSPRVVSAPTSVLDVFFSGADAELSVDSLNAQGLGAAGVSLPSWTTTPLFSWNLAGGTFSMDWGDVDRDGDLDLSAGGDDGTIVYLNDGSGGLTLHWSDITRKPALDTRWANLELLYHSFLDLVTVGRSSDGTPLGAGLNVAYIDAQSNSGQSPADFSSSMQLLRAAPGDYNGDGHIDLVVSSNALNPPAACPVLLYLNNGGGYYSLAIPTCVSNAATASLAPADFDNDGDLDLALGRYQSKEIRVARNTGASPWLSASANYVNVDTSLAHIPYDLAWGDYDRDGYLDLAAAFPLEQEVRIYHNNAGASFSPTATIPTSSYLTPLALDWADLNLDGRLELTVADLPPKIYQYDGASHTFTATHYLPVYTGRIQEIRAIELDNDADLDLALANQYGPSQIFETTAPPLSPTLTIIDAGGAQSVAWGDAGGDGSLDLLFGGELYTYNSSTGDFGSGVTIGSGGLAGAFGDFDGDFDLDIALGTASGCQVYRNPGWSSVPLPSCSGAESLAWGDYNGDAYLDLAVADGSQGVRVYRNNQDNTFTQVWVATGNARSVAWADYNQDYYLDLAVAGGSQGVQVYDGASQSDTFALGPTLSVTDARTVAWGDWDNDGDLDLAVGNYGGANSIYSNQTGSLSATPAWNSTFISNTTSLAWGDWDNDGDLDLAVGNEGERDQAYQNLGGSLSTSPAWESTEVLSTTSVAWGDQDGDGDLDLAVNAQQGRGVYVNNHVLPAHMGNRYMPLPRNPSYLSVSRPGATHDAYFLSSGQILGDPRSGANVPIAYRLYDPDGPRNQDDPLGDPALRTFYSYSLDGGGTWIPTADVSGSWATSRKGRPYTFNWTPPLGAVSDNALFRVSISFGEPAGPVQRASASAVSPPFRLRATTCVWPSGLSIFKPPPATEVAVGERVQFVGDLAQGTGVLTFTWDFGDGSSKTGILTHYQYATPGSYPTVYTVTLTATGELCPVNWEVMTQTTVVVVSSTTTAAVPLVPGDVGADLRRVYLPLILKSGAAETNLGLPQVTGLDGSVDRQAGATYLSWTPSQASDAILGYRVYRASRAAPPGRFELLATLSTGEHSFTDESATCGQMYYVTVFSALGESEASTASYFSPPCQ